MSIFKNLKSLFIHEAPSTGSGEVQDSPTEVAASAAPAPQRKSTPPPDGTTEPAAIAYDDRFLDTLLEALEANNLEGFDYLEFRQALQSLASMDFDEATRFKSAYAMAATMKVSPDHLVRTAKMYLDVLDKEDKAFREALIKQEQSQVKAREQRLDELERRIVLQQKEIENLMESITQSRGETEQIRRELTDVHHMIEGTRARFEKTFHYLYRQIEQDIHKMNQHLK
jgi:uncharacterized coiled-coil protein SlyX